jgi:hypothetical protein
VAYLLAIYLEDFTSNYYNAGLLQNYYCSYMAQSFCEVSELDANLQTKRAHHLDFTSQVFFSNTLETDAFVSSFLKDTFIKKLAHVRIQKERKN